MSGEPAAPDQATPTAPLRIAVLADDLIWATRLVDGIRRAGASPVPLRSAPSFAAALAGVDGVLVDLTARAYDGIAALATATDAGVASIAVGQHDDIPLRNAAKAAGATRVHAYRALFEHGDRELTTWVAALRAAKEEGR